MRRVTAATGLGLILSGLTGFGLTYHSSGFVIVEIHQISQFARFLQLFLVGTIDKLLGKGDAVPQVVTEILFISSLCFLTL